MWDSLDNNMISRLEEWLDDGVGPCYGKALSLDLA